MQTQLKVRLVLSSPSLSSSIVFPVIVIALIQLAVHITSDPGSAPLPIYAVLKIHGTTRDKSLVDTFYKLGMCISYDRLLSISTDITNTVLERYEREQVVCPSKLRKGPFTTAAVDNIDHNPSSTTCKDSFHGTAISLVQHPTTVSPGNDRAVDTFDPTVKSSASKKLHNYL